MKNNIIALLLLATGVNAYGFTETSGGHSEDSNYLYSSDGKSESNSGSGYTSEDSSESSYYRMLELAQVQAQGFLVNGQVGVALEKAYTDYQKTAGVDMTVEEYARRLLKVKLK